jgi:peptidoglycan/xylan/chitin deacetylase (PgdA/CDA1 family)
MRDPENRFERQGVLWSGEAFRHTAVGIDRRCPARRHVRFVDMRRQVILGGAIVIISLASAATYGMVQGKWFQSARQNPAETEAIGASPAQKPEVAATASAWLAQSAPGDADAAVTPVAPGQRSTTVGQPAAQSATQAPATQAPAARSTQLAQAASPPAKPAIACGNPNAMGVSRVVEIDTTGGPGFGSQHFKSYDFLRDHEVVLTFDDGPWPTTPVVLKALADQCLRATFFPIGKHATYHPEILRQVVAAGHTVGSHTWSHADLQAVEKKGGDAAAIEEIEKGVSAVHLMANAPVAPFFRFPDLRHPPEMITYLGGRNIASFSTDIDSFDFKIKKPEELTKSLMGKLNKLGKGIILMHDFQKVTSIALPQILGELQKNGFKVVHMVPKGTLESLPQYDEAVLKENKLPTLTSNKPTESVVHTISGQ